MGLEGEKEQSIICRKDQAAEKRRNAEAVALRNYSIRHGLPQPSGSLPHSTISRIVDRIGPRAPKWFEYNPYYKEDQGTCGGYKQSMNVQLKSERY